MTKKKEFETSEAPRHPAAALISINRMHGTPTPLFRSPVKVGDVICLSISRAHESHNGIHSGGVYDEGLPIVEVWMSEVQFAEAITRLNHGVGVPCTLRRIEREVIELPKEVHQTEAGRIRAAFKRQVKEQMASIEARRERIMELLERGGVGKARAKEVKSELNDLIRMFVDSAPFVMERFEEEVHAVVAEAKTEVAAYTEARIREIGLGAAAEKPPPVLELPMGEGEKP